MDGFISTSNPKGVRALGYYDSSDLGYYYALANTFAIGDRYFASILGPTWPNGTGVGASYGTPERGWVASAGVGGGVAEMVGRQLRTLGQNAQVLCVTHLPQVASQAHSQVRVTKLTDGKHTRTTLEALSNAARVEEIARMLGGAQISDTARAHAQEMLGSAKDNVAKKRNQK